MDDDRLAAEAAREPHLLARLVAAAAGSRVEDGNGGKRLRLMKVDRHAAECTLGQ